METKVFAHEGKIQDRAHLVSWKERREYLKLAAEYGGYSPDPKQEEKKAGLNPQLQALADALNAGGIPMGEMSDEAGE